MTTRAFPPFRVGLLTVGLLLLAASIFFIADPQHGGTTVTTTTGAAPDLVVTAVPGHAARASDTLIVFLLGIGTAFTLAGCAYSRISTLTIGGVGINLTPAASAKLAAKVSQRVGDDPATVEKAYRVAHAALGADYWGRIANPPEEDLDQAAATAAKVVSKTTAP